MDTAMGLEGALAITVSTILAIVSYFLVGRDRKITELEKRVNDLTVDAAGAVGDRKVLQTEVNELKRRADKMSERPQSMTNEAE